MLGVQNLLGIGTLGGYLTIWLASASPTIRITTVEIDEKHANVARQNLEYAGVSARVEIVVGSGLEILPQIAEQINSGKRQPFGFVFIDADKENRWPYFDRSVELAAPGACIVVDNVVNKGQLVEEEVALHDTRVQGSRTF